MFLKKYSPFFLLAFICFGFAGCINDEAQVAGSKTEKSGAAIDANAFTTIQWTDTVRNMASIHEGQNLEVVFRFINSGDKPLVIEKAEPSCGCTVPSKPEEPIMPGQGGEIKAVFSSEGRTGHNHKTITVMANTKPSPSHLLEFNVEVIGKTDGPKAADAGPAKF